MRLSAPSQLVFIISVAIAVLAILIFLGTISFAAIPSFWIMTIAFVVLAVGCLLKGI